ncbi:MAG: RecQ family ATP-dependent DNA helicase [Phycisphaeraceae bacterium]|nr:RecQ family ATP-dependent DNA helicase [Phycisphaeraceae bacterium]
MPGSSASSAVHDVVKQYWGFDSLRPLQAEAIDAGLAKHDSLVVMPTGGGKSLCYQVPPLLSGKMSLVVSPLIALMQDQVAGLALAGYPAAAINSAMSTDDAAAARRDAESGATRLLLVSPERLLTDSFISWLKRLASRGQLESFAIDEAHCISQWGHDFRPEYRRLAELRRHLPGLPLHAYTATATPRVREDIVTQLDLKSPAVLVGRFDRPNLTYRIMPRVRLVDQAAEVIGRCAGEGRGAAIVYCISRKDTESVADGLKSHGINARAYHAGMDAAKRTRVQHDFRTERLNVVVATVAFGMGIDRSDVRCVIHGAMPKTVEHFQQETGRAGRDGLPAECVMFYSAADAVRWKQLMQRSAMEDLDADESITASSAEALAVQFELLSHMQRLCSGARCRHASLSEYFGQSYSPADPAGGCGACDICLGELSARPDAADIARKIISCVARFAMTGQAYGAAHLIDVLRGRATPKVLERRHDDMTTFGLLREMSKEALASYVNQLTDQGVLGRDGVEYPVITLTADSASVLKGQRHVVLLEPKLAPGRRRAGKSDGQSRPLAETEQALFESLRELRRHLADSLAVPPYVVFSDATLEALARSRPSTPDGLLAIKGIGQAKLAQFGERFLERIAEQSRRLGLDLDDTPATPPPRRAAAPR